MDTGNRSQNHIFYSDTYHIYNFKSNRMWRIDGIYEPFVYVVKEIETGMHYIGSHSRKGCLERHLGLKYFGSSKLFDWKSNPDSFLIESIIPCASNHDAIILEYEMIEYHGAV